MCRALKRTASHRVSSFDLLVCVKYVLEVVRRWFQVVLVTKTLGDLSTLRLRNICRADINRENIVTHYNSDGTPDINAQNTDRHYNSDGTPDINGENTGTHYNSDGTPDINGENIGMIHIIIAMELVITVYHLYGL